MSATHFAIDLSDRHISWARAQKRGKTPHLIETGDVSFLSKAELSAFVEQELLPKIKSRDRVTFLIKGPPQFYRLLEFPFDNTRKIAAALPLEMAGKLPLPVEQVELAWGQTGSGGPGTYRVPSLAIPLNTLVDLREFLDQISLPAAHLAPSPFALAPWVAREQSSCFLVHTDDKCSSICLLDQGVIIGYRMLGPTEHLTPKDLAAAIARAAAILNREANCSRLPAVVVGEKADRVLIQSLEKLNLKTRPLQIVEEQSLSPARQTVACLALSGLLDSGNQGLSFSGGQQQGLSLQPGTGKSRATLMVAACALILFLAGGLWAYQLKIRQEDVLSRQLTSTYEATFGSAAKPSDVPRQMRLQLRQLQQRAQKIQPEVPTPLALLAEASRALPRTALTDLDSYEYDETEVRLEGQCSDFDVLENIRAQLASLPGVQDAQIADAKRQPGGAGVRFRIKLRFDQGEG